MRRIGQVAVVMVAVCAVAGLSTAWAADEAPDAAAMNAAFELELFGDGGLWGESVETVAGRLRWRQESRTERLASYRQYDRGRGSVLGAAPWSLAMYAVAGKPMMLSMVFMNKGDYPPFQKRDSFDSHGRIEDEVEEAFEEAINKDARAIYKRLRELLGQPAKSRYGLGRSMREDVLRWDWRGHAILLSVVEAEYVAVRVVPSAMADLEGKPAQHTRDSELQDILEARVVRRENGDVIISQLPMVDQGPKGYCVPATWERYLWYMGIPADMYVLAMAGNTNPGGGTDVSELSNAVRTMVRRHRRKISNATSTPRLNSVAKFVDRGFPLMWPMIVDPALNEEITKRSRERRGVKDWEAWAERMEEIADERKRFKPEGGGHMCMIIGYNKETEEICITDSWGPNFQERWITEAEARAIGAGNLVYISD